MLALTKKMIDAIDLIEIKFKKLPRECGWTVGNIIHIDHTREDWLNTLVHELHHFLFSRLTEKQVIAATNKWIKKSSWHNKVALMQTVFDLID